MPQPVADLDQIYAKIGKRLVHLMRQKSLPLNYAATGTKRKTMPNCTPGKSWSCGWTCLPMSKKNCGSPLPGQAATYAQYLANQAGANSTGTTTATPATPKKTRTKKATLPPAPAPTPTAATASVTTNQTELDKSRNDLEKRFGKATVEAAEKNVKKIMDDPDTNVYVRVGSSSTLEAILGDRFKTSAELGIDTHQIPYLKDGYQKARNRVEEKTLGVGKGTDPADRPIYGYIGGKDPNGLSHKDTADAYGSIAVKLKSDVKDRTTFTAADSFKSGIASEVKGGATPPPPNAASLVASTRHGYDVDKLPAHYPGYYNDKSIHGSQLRQAAKAKTVDDLATVGAPTGNRYIEAQVHGKVTPKDIAEIAFTPKGIGDRPTAAIAKFAKDNGVPLLVNGKRLTNDELDSIITPPADKRSKTLQDLSSALEKGDFDEVIKHTDALYSAARKVKLTSGETDKPLKLLYSEAGFDGLPKVVDSADIDKVWNDGGVLMVRGVGKDPRDPNKYLKQFQSGDYYVGNGIYGNGTYVGHSGDASGKTFVHRPSDPAKAAKNAKNAVDGVAKHNYISASTLNFRMAMDKDSKVVLQSDLKKEQRSLEKKVDAWHAAEQAKIKTRPDPTSNSATAKKYAAAYKQAEAGNADYLTAKPKQIGTFTASNGDVTYEHEVKIKGKTDPISFAVSKRYTLWGSMQWEYRDENGNPQTTKTKKDAIARGHQAAVARRTTKDALTATGLTAPPGKSGGLSNAQQADLIKLDDRVRNMKIMLGLNHNDESNLAVIKGYDAVALNQSYQKDVFMNLLNRSAVYVQKDPLDWNRAKTKGAA